MLSSLRSRVSRHPVLAFYVLAYACSWAIAVPLALQTQRVIHTHLPLWLHYLTAYGPVLAALVVSRAIGGNAADVAHATSRKYERIGWLLLAGGSPLLLFVGAQAVGVLSGASLFDWRTLGRVNFLPHLGAVAWPFWLLTSGFGEEPGWRGFALPRLQKNHSALASSCLVAIAWAGWHLPAFFYIPSYLSIGWRVLPGFFIGVLAGSILLTWLYNQSGGSVTAAAVWHASFNYVTASPSASGLAAAITSMLVIAWAIAIVCWFDSATFTVRRIPRRPVHA